jgi:hypothetical protein
MSVEGKGGTRHAVEAPWLELPRQRVLPRRGVRPRVVAWLIRRVAHIDAANLITVLTHDLRLFFAWLGFASRLVPYGTLDRRDCELTILRVAWNCRCRYEWAQHVQIGSGVGVTPEEIARVQYGSGPPGWSSRQVALIDAADDLHRSRCISEEVWGRLAGELNAGQLIEFCMLVGQYEMVAGLLNSIGVPLDENIEEGLAHFDARA